MKEIMRIERWRQNTDGLWYYIGVGYDSDSYGGVNNPVSAENRDLIIDAFKKGYQDGSLMSTVYYGVDDLIRNDISVADNVAILDEAVGTWHNGKYIKSYRMEDAENTSIGANLQALDYALDNNYYRNIKFSRAEKYKKSPLAERSECIQGSTDFFKKFEDALTIAAQSRHDGLIFVANDNHATTGNTTMYKKEA